MRRIDETDHAVLHQVTEVDRVWHRGRETARQGFDKREAGGNPVFAVRRVRLS